MVLSAEQQSIAQQEILSRLGTDEGQRELQLRALSDDLQRAEALARRKGDKNPAARLQAENIRAEIARIQAGGEFVSSPKAQAIQQRIVKNLPTKFEEEQSVKQRVSSSQAVAKAKGIVVTEGRAQQVSQPSRLAGSLTSFELRRRELSPQLERPTQDIIDQSPLRTDTPMTRLAAFQTQSLQAAARPFSRIEIQGTLTGARLTPEQQTQLISLPKSERERIGREILRQQSLGLFGQEEVDGVRRPIAQASLGQRLQVAGELRRQEIETQARNLDVQSILDLAAQIEQTRPRPRGVVETLTSGTGQEVAALITKPLRVSRNEFFVENEELRAAERFVDRLRISSVPVRFTEPILRTGVEFVTSPLVGFRELKILSSPVFANVAPERRVERAFSFAPDLTSLAFLAAGIGTAQLAPKALTKIGFSKFAAQITTEGGLTAVGAGFTIKELRDAFTLPSEEARVQAGTRAVLFGVPTTFGISKSVRDIRINLFKQIEQAPERAFPTTAQGLGTIRDPKTGKLVVKSASALAKEFKKHVDADSADFLAAHVTASPFEKFTGINRLFSHKQIIQAGERVERPALFISPFRDPSTFFLRLAKKASEDVPSTLSFLPETARPTLFEIGGLKEIKVLPEEVLLFEGFTASNLFIREQGGKQIAFISKRVSKVFRPELPAGNIKSASTPEPEALLAAGNLLQLQNRFRSILRPRVRIIEGIPIEVLRLRLVGGGKPVPLKEALLRESVLTPEEKNLLNIVRRQEKSTGRTDVLAAIRELQQTPVLPKRDDGLRVPFVFGKKGQIGLGIEREINRALREGREIPQRIIDLLSPKRAQEILKRFAGEETASALRRPFERRIQVRFGRPISPVRRAIPRREFQDLSRIFVERQPSRPLRIEKGRTDIPRVDIPRIPLRQGRGVARVPSSVTRTLQRTFGTPALGRGGLRVPRIRIPPPDTPLFGLPKLSIIERTRRETVVAPISRVTPSLIALESGFRKEFTPRELTSLRTGLEIRPIPVLKRTKSRKVRDPFALTLDLRRINIGRRIQRSLAR
jgi:hypothetical protein